MNIEYSLIRAGVSSKIDDSGTSIGNSFNHFNNSVIGKRYARTDECGIPFAITVDNDTLKENTVTLRDLNTMKQIRVPVRKFNCLCF